MNNSQETTEGELYNRDQILAQVDELLKIEDAQEKDEKISQFIKDRIRTLNNHSVAREFSIFSASRRGYLHPDSPIRRNFSVDPFHVDDDGLYDVLFSVFIEFKGTPGWKEKSLREIVLYVVQRAIGIYFGNHLGGSNTENNNRAFYSQHSMANSEDLHLKEFRGKNIAVCAEKASAAQNLLGFLGYTSEIVISACKLSQTKESDEEFHMFNVISNGENHFIFDSENPIIARTEDRNIQSVMPAIYPISHEQYTEFMSGGNIEITHIDTIWDGNDYIQDVGTKRIYAGPKK